MPLTPEQINIINISKVLKPKEILKIQACAGSGKTTTLCEIAKANPQKKFLYLAFNKAIAEEVKAKMPKNVESKTIHSLAYAKMIRIFKKMDLEKKINAYDLEPFFALNLSGLSELIKDFETFCKSDLSLNLATPNVRAMWNLVGKKMLPMTHDYYLKAFSMLKNNSLDSKYRCIMLDEAQDTNKVMLQIFLNNNCSKILVGDSFQNIYGFNQTINALKLLQAHYSLSLNTSFRSTQEILDYANYFLNTFSKQKQERMISGQQGAESGKQCTEGGNVICHTERQRSIYKDSASVDLQVWANRNCDARHDSLRESRNDALDSAHCQPPSAHCNAESAIRQTKAFITRTNAKIISFLESLLEESKKAESLAESGEQSVESGLVDCHDSLRESRNDNVKNPPQAESADCQPQTADCNVESQSALSNYFLQKNANDLFELPFALYDFNEGKPLAKKFSFLNKFDNIQKLDEYADAVNDIELSHSIDLIKRYDKDLMGELFELAKKLNENKDAPNIITNAHQAKGLEWDFVEIQDDFPGFFDLIFKLDGKLGWNPYNAEIFNFDKFYEELQQELNLFYVAITRARFGIKDKTINRVARAVIEKFELDIDEHFRKRESGEELTMLFDKEKVSAFVKELIRKENDTSA